MKPQDQNLAIAKLMGLGPFQNFNNKGRQSEHGVRVRYKYCLGGGAYEWRQIPDYVRDLNACRTFEMTLKSEGWEIGEYCETLWRVTCPTTESHSWHAGFCAATATASQRCEALLNVRGLWKDA